MKSLKFAAVAAIVAASLSSTAFAQSSRIFLDIAGVAGDATSPGFEGQIEIQSVRYGFSNPDAKKLACSAQNFYFVKEVDKASADILVASALGTIFPNAKVTVARDSGGSALTPLIQYSLSGMRFTSFQTGGSAFSLPNESFSMRFSALSGTVYNQNPGGGVTPEPFALNCY
jgi:type VI protein secretion system component Hcp